MRITRAYTITREVKNILDTKPNKSDYVCRAVRHLHIGERDFSLRDMPVDDILRYLVTRGSTPSHIKAVIQAHLNQES